MRSRHGSPSGPPIGELIRQARAADKCDPTVDQQQLAVIAQEVAQPVAPMQSVEEAQVDARAEQTPAVSLRQSERAETVEQHANAHASPGGARQRLDEAAGDDPDSTRYISSRT